MICVIGDGEGDFVEYKIGEFSKIVKISPRMLRFLDKEEILKPSYIGENGYRYYNDNDIDIAKEIVNLRKFHFSYVEIKNMIENESTRDIDIYKEKLLSIKNQIDDYEDLLIELRKITDSDSNLSQIHNSYNIYHLHKKETYTYIKSFLCYERELDEIIENCLDDIEKQGLKCVDTYGLLFNEYKFESDNLDKIDVRFIQDVIIGEDHIDGYNNPEVVKSGGCQFISTIHYGGYEDISKASNMIYTYAKENNYEIVGGILERYMVDGYLVDDSDNYITEVSVEVIKKS